LEFGEQCLNLSFPPRICHSRESGNPARGKLQRESRFLLQTDFCQSSLDSGSLLR